MHHIFDEPTDAKRIYREMHILRQLNHPQIIRILDIVCPNLKTELFEGFDSSIKASENQGKRHRATATSSELSDLYLVFEFVDTDLYKLISSAQYLTTAHIQTFLYQLLLGLKYLHSANVIHRDLKV